MAFFAMETQSSILARNRANLRPAKWLVIFNGFLQKRSLCFLLQPIEALLQRQNFFQQNLLSRRHVFSKVCAAPGWLAKCHAIHTGRGMKLLLLNFFIEVRPVVFPE